MLPLPLGIPSAIQSLLPKEQDLTALIMWWLIPCGTRITTMRSFMMLTPGSALAWEHRRNLLLIGDGHSSCSHPLKTMAVQQLSLIQEQFLEAQEASRPIKSGRYEKPLLSRTFLKVLYCYQTTCFITRLPLALFCF